MSNLALPSPQSPNSTAFGPHGSAPGPWLGLSHTQKLALAAVIVCVAATAWAAIAEVDLNEVRIPIAGISLLCAFMSPAALPDWRGKAAFVVFMLFTGFVVRRDDPTRDAAPRILESAGEDPAARAGRQSLRAERLRRAGEFSVAAAQLHLRSLAEPPAGFASHTTSASGQTERAATDELVSLQLDSIRAIHDGSSGTSDWRFDVYVNRYLQLPLGLGTYHDAPGGRTKRIGRAAQFPAQDARTVQVQVQGVRSALFGNYVAGGRSETFPLSELDHGRQKQVIVPVVADEEEHGQFNFYFTIRRL